LGERSVSPKKALWCSTRTCEMGLERIVSKREGSFYRCGRSRNWLKTKNPDFVRT
jgi:ATP-dependent DNA ligase